MANGVVADEDIPVDAVMQSLMFVTGKYGGIDRSYRCVGGER